MAIECKNVEAELEDFLYGELTERRASEIRSHLAGCRSCDAARAGLERENEIYAEFFEQTAIDPSPEMWQAIQARIAGQASERNTDGLFGRLFSGGWLPLVLSPALVRQAAFAALLVAVSVTVTILYLRSGEPGAPQVARNEAPAPSPVEAAAPEKLSPPSAAPSAPVETPRPKPAEMPAMMVAAADRRALSETELIARQLRRAEKEYQGAIRMLDRAIARRRDSYDTETIRQYETSLALIDRSINESRLALSRRPDDVAAGQFLIAAYARKVDLMQDIAMR